MKQMNELIELLTSSLNIHLNIGQDTKIDTPQIFMSLETTTLTSLSNKLVKQLGNAQIQLPQTFNTNLTDDSKVSIRVHSFFLFFLYTISFRSFSTGNDGTFSFVWQLETTIEDKSFDICLTIDT
jgi:hypothetical protein